MIEVDGHQWVVSHCKDAFQRPRCGGLQRLVDFGHGEVAAGNPGQVHYRDVGGRHADRGAIQLALKFRDHQAESLGGAGRGGDHRHGGGAGAVEV